MVGKWIETRPGSHLVPVGAAEKMSGEQEGRNPRLRGICGALRGRSGEIALGVPQVIVGVLRIADILEIVGVLGIAGATRIYAVKLEAPEKLRDYKILRHWEWTCHGTQRNQGLGERKAKIPFGRRSDH